MKRVDISWDEQMGQFYKTEPVKRLDTGLVYEYYRIAGDYVVVEHIMSGFAHTFLDSFEIVTKTGLRIAKRYRIRKHTIDGPESTKQIVLDAMLSAAQSEWSTYYVNSSIVPIMYTKQLQKLSESSLHHWIQLHRQN